MFENCFRIVNFILSALRQSPDFPRLKAQKVRCTTKRDETRPACFVSFSLRSRSHIFRVWASADTPAKEAEPSREYRTIFPAVRLLYLLCCSCCSRTDSAVRRNYSPGYPPVVFRPFSRSRAVLFLCRFPFCLLCCFFFRSVRSCRCSRRVPDSGTRTDYFLRSSLTAAAK